MSTPRSLAYDPSVTSDTLSTARGPRAALRARPAGAPRGSVVLVPGFTGSKEDFLTLLPLLAANGYGAVSYDQLGQYESPGSDSEADYDLSLLAADLNDIVAAQQAPVHVVGHSFGALVVTDAVIAMPTSYASVSIIACALGPLTGALASALEQLLLIPVGTSSQTVWQIRRELEGPLDPRLSPDVAAFVEAKFVASPLAAMQAKARILLNAPDRAKELAATGRRFLVATGASDDYWPIERQIRLAETLGTSLALFSDCGHSPAVDDPEQVASLLGQFWT